MRSAWTCTRLACVVLMASFVAAVATGCDSAPAARGEPPPPRVSVARPEVRQLVDHDDYNGWIQSPQTVDVRSRVRGHIVKIHFTDGELVKDGQLLFELDPRPLQQDIDRAKEQVNIVQSQLNVALLEEKRMAQLQKTSSASPLEVETTEAKARSLESQVEATKKELERKQLELEYSRITSPIAGRIGRAMLDVGNLVNAGGTDPVLTTIVAVDPIQVYFSVDERSLQRYQKLPGGPAASETSAQTRRASMRAAKIPFRFGLETDEGYPYEGVLDFASNRIDPTTGTIEIRGAVANALGQFVPGSRVRVRVPVSAERAAVLVPDTAILSDQDKKYVLALDEKNVVHRRDVRLGKLLDDGMRVILPESGATTSPSAAAATTGLSANDRIITLGLQMARVNYAVEPIESGSPSAAPAAATQPVAAAGQ